MSAKARRQPAVTRLIESTEIASQAQLVELLSTEGISATQATVSRDLDDIGAIKIRSSSGQSIYALPAFVPDRVAPLDQLRRVMGEWVAEVTCSGSLVVVRTPPGCAHVVASALDRSGVEGLIGTVAGDDTMLCVASEEIGGALLADTLRELAGLDSSNEERGR